MSLVSLNTVGNVWKPGSGVISYTGGGNVGIGTTNALDDLHIHSATAAQLIGIRLSDETTTAGAARGSLIAKDTSQNLQIRNYENQDMSFFTNNTERMRILAGGNVGIGSTNPTQKLQVSGNIQALGKYIVQDSVDGGTLRGIYMWNAGDASWGIYMGQSGATKSLSGGTACTGGGDFTTHAIRFRVQNNANNGFIFENSSETCLMSIRGSDGIVYFSNNIRLSTSVPSSIGWNNGGTGTGSLGYASIPGAYSTSADTGDIVLRAGQKLHLQNGSGNSGITLSGNNVGIGTANPSATYKLFVQGQIGASNDITAFISDERLKTKIGNIDNALDIVSSLSCFKYKMNDVAKQYGFNDDKVHVGVSAQELQKLVPEVVRIAPFDSIADENGETISASGSNYLTVKYDKLVPVLIQAIKELKEIVDANY
jgi:hypothetical protein